MTLLVLGAARVNFPALVSMAKVANVVAIDANPTELTRIKNLEVIKQDFSDIDGLRRIVHKYSVSGAYPMNDHAIRPAAKLVEEFGFVGLAGVTAENFLDKGRMRSIWDQHELPQPRFLLVDSLTEAVKAASTLGYPLIVKPAASGGGGRGVVKLENETDLVRSFHLAKQAAKYVNQVILETYIGGQESSVEVAFIRGRASIIAMSVKRKLDSKFQVADRILYPAKFGKSLTERVHDVCTAAGTALGIHTGVAHFEVIVDSADQVYLVEVGGRAGGGHTFHPIASHVAGLNYPSLVADIYLGRLKRAEVLLSKGIRERSAIYAFPMTEQEGMIQEIDFGGVGNHESLITEIWKSRGEQLSGVKSSMDRLGAVVALSDSLQKAQEIADGAMSLFRVIVAESQQDTSQSGSE